MQRDDATASDNVRAAIGALVIVGMAAIVGGLG